MSKKETPNYDRLKREARSMFMDGKQQKEIAQVLNVSEVSISRWATEGNWKAEYNNNLTRKDRRKENIEKIIDNLSEQHVSLLEQISKAESKNDFEKANELRERADGLADQASKWSKKLEEREKEERISLSVYLDVMESVFNSMKSYSMELYHSTIDFQEMHVYEMSKRLG